MNYRYIVLCFQVNLSFFLMLQQEIDKYKSGCVVIIIIIVPLVTSQSDRSQLIGLEISVIMSEKILHMSAAAVSVSQQYIELLLLVLLLVLVLLLYRGNNVFHSLTVAIIKKIAKYQGFQNCRYFKNRSVEVGK